MSNNVWAIVQPREGRVGRGGWELIAAAQTLASQLGGAAVEVVVLGSGNIPLAEEIASKAAVAAVRLADHDSLAAFTPGAWCDVLGALIEQESPQLVVFGHSYQTMDYVPRLVARFGAAFVPAVLSTSTQDGELRWKRPVLGGKLHATVRTVGDGPVFVTVQPGAFSPDSLVAGTSSVQAVAVGAVDPQRTILRTERAGGDTVDLSKSDVVVAAGRGVGGADKMGVIEELAAALGADIGASRPVIDNGWLPRDRQIGSSGQTVAPRLYVAVGISGAIQHLVGMKGSGCVVAINKDPGAPIFSVANYGIVGDLHEIVPALSAAIREAKAQ